MKPDYIICANCTFFYEDQNGECRRHAPMREPGNGNSDPNRAFPFVMSDDWCGDFIGKDSACVPTDGKAP